MDASVDTFVQHRALSGWGRHPVVESRVVRPETRSQLRAVLEATSEPVLAHGAGRSYGDAALNPRGLTILTERLNRMIAFDPETGRLRCEAGVRLGEILDVFVPRGWFVPVTPGTKAVTLGGAVAFDVHGKNHHGEGSFAHFVRAIELLTASGACVRCSRQERAELFWATVGGAGLTGFITEVELELRRIETACLRTRRIKTHHLDEAFDAFEAHDPRHTYAVAWIDAMARGDSLGRGLCMFGDHARADELGKARRARPLAYAPRRYFSVPIPLPRRVLGPTVVRCFNRMYHARQRREEVRRVEDIDAFFYPLDAVGQWNRMYGPDGFVQYQCVLPMDESRMGITHLLEHLHTTGWPCYLAVLKRMGPASDGMLSFPMRGYTLALDIPRRDGIEALLHALDAIVLQHGGRIYLAKDAALRPEAFRAMYPRHDEWLNVKRRVDPDGRFTSALARRLQLVPEAVYA